MNQYHENPESGLILFFFMEMSSEWVSSPIVEGLSPSNVTIVKCIPLWISRIPQIVCYFCQV